MTPVRQFADGRVAIRMEGIGPDEDGTPYRWCTVDGTHGASRLTVFAHTDADVADAVPMVPSEIEPAPHDGPVGSTDWTDPWPPQWAGPFRVGDHVLVSTGALALAGGQIGRIDELWSGGLWLDCGGTVGRTWFPASGIGSMARAAPVEDSDD